MNNITYAERTWKEVIQHLLDENIITQMSFDNWFKSSSAIAMDSKTLTVQAEDNFSLEWMQSNYQEMLENHVEELLGQRIKIFFVVKPVPQQEPQQEFNAEMRQYQAQPQLFSQEPTPSQSYQEPNRQQTSSQMLPQQYNGNGQTPSIQQPQQETPLYDGLTQSEAAIKYANLNPKLTFDNFVSGSSNQLAYNIGKAIAENPGNSYNPMFLYGGSGLGKTHLIQAIGNEIIVRFPGKRVLYVTSEAFLSDYVASIRAEKTESFREKYRKIDVLIIDDIQFFVGKEGIQEEFFHTFNHLHQLNKQIIITSDSQPNELTTLTERLRSRFSWGILTDIQAPELETRMAILHKKIASFASEEEVPDDVIEYIASNIDTNVRDLEGALNGLFAHAVMLGKLDITLDLAVESLRSYTKSEQQKITVARIQKVTAKYFHISVEEIKSKARKEPLATHRHICVYLCKKLTPNSLKQIGKHFGNRDHTTIMNSVKRVEALIAKDPDIQAVIEELEKQIVL